MESATSNASMDSQSPRDTDQTFSSFCGIHVLRGANIVGTIHLVLSFLAFVFCLVLPTIYDLPSPFPQLWRLGAVLICVPIGIISAFLLLGIAYRRAFFLIPFLFLYSFLFILQSAVTVVAAVSIFVCWCRSITKGDDLRLALTSLAGMVICTCVEGLSLAFVYRSYRHLRGHTEESIDCKSERGVNIVGIAHLYATYLSFNLSLILPVAVEEWNWAVICFIPVALFVFVPIGAINVLLLVGVAKRRHLYLLPFLAFCSIAFLFQAAGTTVWAVHNFIHWNESSDADKWWAAIALIILAICTCLEAWSLAIVYRSYRRLRGMKADIGQDTSIEPRLPTYAEAVYHNL